ncbi:MAG: hypothetical protein KAQ63_02935 [Candidatus Moranbacteria bacterium]|nr:hypothetical protein [Candidatus Moranbacteria bacterium]
MKTKILKNNLILFIAVAVLSFLGVDVASANDAIENQIVNYTNQERVAQGLEQLVENDILNEVAKLKVQDMLGNDYFSHTSLEGLDPWYWFDRAGYSYRFAGENLGMDFETAFAVHDAWMKSETHKENILSTKYKEIGVAVKRGLINNKETQIAVQVFGNSLRDSDPIPENFKEEPEPTILEDRVIIAQSSIHFWKGSEEDEMLVSAEVTGNPQGVEAVVGTEEYPLEKLKDDIYVNLISLKGLDIKKENVLIKAVDDQKIAIFSKVPDKYFAEYLIEKEEQDTEDNQVVAMLSSDQNNQNNLIGTVRLWFNQTGFMLLIAGLFIITIFNIWILEKEEERLLELKT